MRQARYSVEHPRVIFRETFNSEFDVRRNGGTPTDVTFSNGIGTFDGAASVVTYEREGLRQANPWSVRIRFKAGVTATGNLFSCGYNGTDRTGIAFDTGEIRCGTRTSSWLSRSTALTDTDSWHEVVAAHPGGNVRLSAYLDGVVMTGVNSPAGTPTEHFSIGAIFTPSNFFTGDISLIEIYNYALTAEEVANLHNDSRFHEIGVSGLQSGTNIMSNCGTPETTDWVDTNLDGAADNWTVYGVGSIVTGNGFIGNAQRIDNVNGSGDRLQSLPQVVSGNRYRIRMKYRGNAQILFQQGGSGLPSSPINTGDAQIYDEVWTPISNSTVWLRINTIGYWFEVDELYVALVNVEQTSEILNVSAQSGSIINKYTGDQILPNLMDAGKGKFDSGVETWLPWATNVLSNDGGALKIVFTSGTGSAGGGYTYFRSASDINTNLTVGSLYLIKIRAKNNGATCGVRIHDGVGFGSTMNVTSEYLWYEIYFVALSATAGRVQCGNMGLNDILWIDEWHLIQINTAVVNTATTVFKDGAVRAMSNSINSKIDCGDPDGVGMIGDRTFVWWWKPYRDHSDASDRRIFENGKLRIRTGGNRRLYILNDGVTFRYSAVNYWTNNEWIFCVLTRAAIGTTILYKNGEEHGPSSGTDGTPVVGTTNLIVGNTDALGLGINGLLGDVRIYSGLLSAAKISQLFSNERKKYGI